MYSKTISRADGIPQSSGIIERARLLERLQGALEHKLTLITAPPGFGKTTVVAQFTRNTPVAVVWQTIDERSRDVPTLYAQAIEALTPVFPGITQLAPPFGYGPAELATLLCDYLADHNNHELIYVLDDVHLMTGVVAAENWLRGLVNALPRNCHLILASRALPRLPLVEMIARGEVLAIGLDELRFTPDEVSELGTALLGARPRDEQVSQLTARLEGWPAGTILAFHPLSSGLEEMTLGGQSGPEALFEALARVTLQTQPPGLRQFLLASSTLARFTPELCADALGLSNAAPMLLDIQRRNLFVSRVPGALVYHTLFRNFLQTELKNADEDWFRELHSRAARWFETNDQPDEAFAHYIQCRMPESAAVLAEHMANAYYVQNRFETLLSWNANLREHRVPAPRLSLRCAQICIQRYDYVIAEEWLHETEISRVPDDEDTSLEAIRIQYGLIHVLRGNGVAAIECVADIIETETAPTLIRGAALKILGLAKLNMGKVSDALQHYEEALPLYRMHADIKEQAQLLHNLVIANWRSGRLSSALQVLHEVVALRRSLGGSSPLAMSLNSLGYIYHQLNDYEHAVAVLQEGLSAIARFPDRRAEGYLVLNLADVRRDEGETEEAIGLYNRALIAVSDSEPALSCSILCGLSTLYRWQGQADDAVAAAQEAIRLARKNALGYEGRVARLSLNAAQPQSDESHTTLSELLEITAELEAHDERFDLMQGLALCARFALLADQVDSAEQYIDRALTLGDALGAVGPLAQEILHYPTFETFIRQKTRKYHSLIGVVVQLRGLRHNRQEIEILVDEHLPDTIYSLRIITMGQTRIIRDGHIIPTADWRPAARDMFLYIVFNKQASREQICAAFWPDSPAKKARDNFHSTMYRIRDVLGETTLTATKDGTYEVNPNISIWCDAFELETLAAQARILPAADARTEDLWRRAVGLHNGDFLPALDLEWANIYRENLQETYVEALTGLGHCAQARGNYREAIDIYKRALTIDPYRESIYQAIMTCYIASGAKHKALEQLNQLRKLLLKDLGIGPSTETLTFVRTLFT